MKILVLSQYWAPENGVPQRRWAWLTKILVRAGHEVLVVTPPPHYMRNVTLKDWWKESGLLGKGQVEQGENGETILRSGFFPAGRSLTSRIFNQAIVAGSMLLARPSKARGLKGYRPEVVIGTVPALPTSVATWVVARRLRAPYILDLRDAWPELLHNSHDWNSGTGKRSLREKVFSKGPLQVLIRVTDRSMCQALNSASGIITTSAELQTHLERTMPLLKGGKQRFYATVRNVFPPRAPYVPQEKSDRDQGHLNVLYAGTIGRAQKLDNALKAAQIARDRGFDVRLRFLGDGASFLALRKEIAEKNIDAQIEHRVPADDLIPHYDWADTALVHLTNWEPLNRTIPSKAYELMTMGIHISAVVSGEAAELIESLHAGHVVEPENPESLAELWIDLIKDRSKLAITDEGANWVEHQRNEVVPVQFLEIVEAVAKQG